MTKKVKVQTAVIAIATILVLILIFQNTTPVETNVLFVSFTLPRFVLLLVTMAVGFVAGYSTHSYLKSRHKG